MKKGKGGRKGEGRVAREILGGRESRTREEIEKGRKEMGGGNEEGYMKGK